MKVFSERLKERRKELNLIQADVGEAICVSKQEICLYENDKRTPPLEVLIELSKFLNTNFLLEERILTKMLLVDWT